MGSSQKRDRLRSYCPQKKRARVDLPNSFSGTVYLVDTLEAAEVFQFRSSVAGVSIAYSYFPATRD